MVPSGLKFIPLTPGVSEDITFDCLNVIKPNEFALCKENMSTKNKNIFFIFKN